MKKLELVTEFRTIQAWYDNIVLMSGVDGIAPVAVRAELHQKWLAAARRGGASRVIREDDLSEIGRLIVAEAVARVRQSRNSTKSRSMGQLVKAIVDGWIGDLPPEHLDRAYPVGNGIDKTLGEWTSTDLGEWLDASRVALEEATSAHERNRSTYAALIPKVGMDRTVRQVYEAAGGVSIANH